MKRHTSFGVIVVFQSQFLDVRFNVDEVQVCFIRTTHSSCHENVPVRGDFTTGKLCLYCYKNLLIIYSTTLVRDHCFILSTVFKYRFPNCTIITVGDFYMFYVTQSSITEFKKSFLSFLLLKDRAQLKMSLLTCLVI